MRKKTHHLLVIVLLITVVLSSCTLPRRSTTTAPTDTTAPSEEAILEESPTVAAPLPTDTPTSEPTSMPSPTPTITNTPLPTPTNTPAVSIPNKSSVTGEKMPNGEPATVWKGIPIPEGAISGQQKKDDYGDQYYTFTIQSDAESLDEYYVKALVEKGWDSILGGRSDDVAYAYFTKGNKTIQIIFFIEDTDPDLVLVRIYKR